MGRWSQYRRRGRTDTALFLALSSAALTVDVGGLTGTLRLTFNKALAAGDNSGVTLTPVGGFGTFSASGLSPWLAGVLFVDISMVNDDLLPAAPEVLIGETELSNVFFAQVDGQACPNVTDFPCPQSL